MENSISKDLSAISLQDFLENGTHFGHEAKRWNPKMGRFIYAQKNNIHIIDISQTLERLKVAAKFLEEAASRGHVLFVSTKRQAVEIVRDAAIRSGSYYMTARWVGGLLTNFATIKKSLNALVELEKSFEEGVLDRTKYEVALMKKEWSRLFRLYGGVKTLSAKPTAVVILDTNYEKAAVKEARKIGIPVVGLIDTNSDPEDADYPIPANDDAIKSIRFLINLLADAVIKGNKGNGVKHSIKDYSKIEVKIIKREEETKSKAEVINILPEKPVETPLTKPEVKRSSSKVKGILERVKEEAQKKETKKGTKKPATPKSKVSKPTKEKAAKSEGTKSKKKSS